MLTSPMLNEARLFFKYPIHYNWINHLYMIGGIYSIADVVDEAHHRMGKAASKYLVTEMVSWATGGPSSTAAQCRILMSISTSPPLSGKHL